MGAVLSAVLAACSLQAQNSPQAPPQNSGDPQISHAGREFLRDAAQANQAEISMANVAEARSQNDAVRKLAQMMLDDHQKNLALVQGIAQAHAVQLDSALDMMNQHSLKHLQKAGDVDFNREYTTMMLKDHVKCIKRFDKAVAEIQEPYVKDYAQNTLPALRKHLRHCEDAARAVGVDETTISTILKGLPADESQRAVTFNQN